MSYSRGALCALFFALVLSFPMVTAAQAQEGAASAPPSKVENFGTWSKRCQTNPENQQEVCHAFVDVRVDAGDDKKIRVLYLGIGYSPDKKGMFAIAMVPLGAVLPVGIGFQVDEGKKFGGAFSFCTPAGCQSDLLFDDAKIAELKGGNNLKVTFTDIRRGQIDVPIGLDGISAALNALPKP